MRSRSEFILLHTITQLSQRCSLKSLPATNLSTAIEQQWVDVWVPSRLSDLPNVFISFFQADTMLFDG